MAKYLVETYYTCTFKVNHYLDNINETELKNLEKRDDGKFEVLDVKLDYRKTKSLSLKNNNIVKSIRGAKGGNILEIPAEEIKISNIITAVDEEVKMLNCKKESKKGCNSKSSKCITHNLWDDLEQHINLFFERKSLNDFLEQKNKN